MPEDPCKKKVSDAAGGVLSESMADKLLAKIREQAKNRAESKSMNIEDAMREVAGELIAQERLNGELQVRNLLLDVRARRGAKQFIRQFKTTGEGLIAFMEGTNKQVLGGRRSVDYQQKALHGKFLGRLISELEQADLLRDFRGNDLGREIYIEMGELHERGTPGKSGSKAAEKIAKIIEGVTSEMVARQNRAGAFIDRIPGYVVRQTHDMNEIRRAGGVGTNQENRRLSFEAWNEFTLPLLDLDKTMAGKDIPLFMRNVHEALYTGTHGPEIGEFENMALGVKQDLSKKASAKRVLHFKDAEAAWKYNERFGSRSIKDQVFSDIYYRSKSIAAMENFGPSVEQNFERLTRELREEARAAENAGASSDSLNDWRIQALFEQMTGKSDIPVNHTLARSMNNVRALTIMAKMGGTVVNAISDKVFMNAEFAYQGISRIESWVKQFTGMAARTPENKQFLRLMGVAMDGIIGNTISRYTSHADTSKVMHSLQQKMFDLNFMNWWTDTHKAAAAELMSAHLGEHAGVSFDELPGELRDILPRYNISRTEWDVIRNATWDNGDGPMITPDQLNKAPQELIDKVVAARDLKVNDVNRQRVRDDLDLSLRTYYTDRIDVAVPTPGAAEKKYTMLGTRPGTPLGEAVRMVMMFKAFPITILTKILNRDIYSKNDSIKHWAMNNHRGKFNTATMLAGTIAAGYISGMIKDTIKGKERKEFFTDGKLNQKTLLDAASRGGGLGIMGDYLFNEYDSSARALSKTLVGPVLGQLDPLAAAITDLKQGEVDKSLQKSGKLFLDNTPFINLIYIRPVLDYFIFWNLQEFLDPGSLRRAEEISIKKNNQDYWYRPSER